MASSVASSASEQGGPGQLSQRRTLVIIGALLHPDQHPALLDMLDRLTYQLAASGETPGRDLDPAATSPATGTAPDRHD